MKERNQRLKAIKKIIKANHIESQESLLQLLEKEGIVVTQATLSRDLKLLKVGKISQGNQGYYYTLPSDDERRESERSYIEDFLRGYVSIDFSLNIGVIRTLSGHAGSVALAIDCLNFEDILGTIAGDDTVLVVIKEGVSHVELLSSIKEKIPELEE